MAIAKTRLAVLLSPDMLCRCLALNRLSERRATLSCWHYSEYRVNDCMPRIVRPAVLIMRLSQKIIGRGDSRWRVPGTGILRFIK